MTVRAHVLVSGKVQGVFFRSETRSLARRLGVTGWVKNRRDGRVEAVLEGGREEIDKMVEFCRRGPAGARVTDVEVRWETSTEEFEGFNIRYNY